MAQLETNPISTISQEKVIKDIALVGNPNTGKTSIFNLLTGMRQKVGNYAGVTVERKTGVLEGPGYKLNIFDLPGLYSLIPKSIDDKIAAEIMCGADPSIDLKLIVVVLDAGNLSRNFYLLSQILDLGIPVIAAMNMMDVADQNGLQIDVEALKKEFGIPIIPIVANKKRGIDFLKKAIFKTLSGGNKATIKKIPISEEIDSSLKPIEKILNGEVDRNPDFHKAQALRFLSSDLAVQSWTNEPNNQSNKENLENAVKEARHSITEKGFHWSMLETKLRYKWIDGIVKQHVLSTKPKDYSQSDKLDKVLTNRFAGPPIFLIIFALIFQTIFTWAEVPMDAIDAGIVWIGNQITAILPAGVLQSMIVDGAIAGVGAILVFLPQILFLFFFLSILEDTGYMARVAFMLDRVMRVIGLSGRSVIPLLSSFACAIPGIMATRTIHSWRDRMVTIMIAPFMSCSARLPVYVLMIGAFIPQGTVFGFISYAAITLLAMYTLGIVAAVVVAFIFQNFIRKSMPTSSSFVMELPPYRRPSLRWTTLQMYERAKIFVQDAGKIILAMSIVLWFLASYPKADEIDAANGVNQIEQSYVGQIGKFIEPAIKPLGFDWKIGIGLLTSFAAREVMVSTLATIYNVEGSDESSVNLKTALQNDTDPETGEPLYSSLMAISLMVFFVLACQCMATVAIVKRETNSWRWPLIMIGYMTGLAYFASLVVYQGGLILGF
ncbi:MAG: ferrous iron transport protein B [Calditrichaeota bacterium]|nr:MAG: ferrous iron transport protein B [Calditrichota bacterium]MBL1204643.1 ferrous iron transport protein B [Calditrichota bacterium]NOG44471.1 ferrous iron transport protein B [Calditrichota bacterium]